MQRCGNARSADHRRLRRYAIQLVGQLPENESEAVAVILYMRELVSGYMNNEAAPTKCKDCSCAPKLEVVRRATN